LLLLKILRGGILHSLKIKTTMSKTNAPNPTKKPRKPRTEEVFDQDHAWKKFISNNFFNCLARINPKLYVAVDKSVPPVFLEQEFHNDLRGKYKVTDKEKRGDKLVKLRLLSGEDHFVFLHSEIQDQLRDNIPDRICTYRILIHLRYQTHDITSVAIFTGKVPAKKHKIFIKECYGSKMTYSYISFIIAKQNVRKLQKSNNPFDIALLAAKYTLNTEGDEQRRLLFKQKVFEIALKKNIPLEKMEELLSFVLDYMHLSPKMENEFISKSPFYQPINDDTMVKTRGQKLLAHMISSSVYAKRFEEILSEKEAETLRLVAEKEAEKEAEKALERSNTIKKLLAENFSPEKIADLLDYDLAFVQTVALQFEQEKSKSN
jgi:hypothetical protein